MRRGTRCCKFARGTQRTDEILREEGTQRFLGWTIDSDLSVGTISASFVAQGQVALLRPLVLGGFIRVFLLLSCLGFTLSHIMSSPSNDFATHVPSATSQQINQLKELGSAWAAANGMVVMRPTGIQVAPCSLRPSPFPRSVYKQIREEGVRQKVCLGVHRSDYMLHDPGDGSPLVPRQVEINTIASSFAALSEKASLMHKFLLDRVPTEGLSSRDCPDNEPIDVIASAIAESSQLYCKAEPPATPKSARNVAVLFIVQKDEGNIFDQRHLEFRIFQKHKIPVMRATMAEVEEEAVLDEGSRKLTFRDQEVSVIYFRAGYAPTDYYGDAEWRARLKMERSAAVKCPTLAYQCVGAKKIQQVLAAPGMTEKFVDAKTAKRIRECFAGLYPLGDGSHESIQAKQAGLTEPSKYVLKPQREGGGNNWYDEDLKHRLSTLSDAELQAYILMDIIRAPKAPAHFLRDGNVIETDAIGELGTYGVVIANDKKIVKSEFAGHLLRSKMASSKETGVAAGFGVIDSPVLYD